MWFNFQYKGDSSTSPLALTHPLEVQPSSVGESKKTLEKCSQNQFYEHGRPNMPIASVCVCVRQRESREREREEGRLEPRLQPAERTASATALNGSASYSKRDGTICVAQDLFPGDNSVLISRPQPTQRAGGARGRRGEGERGGRGSDVLFLFQSLPARSSDVRGDPPRSRALNDFSVLLCACLLPACNKGVGVRAEEKGGIY